jgi:hypothetical protein
METMRKYVIYVPVILIFICSFTTCRKKVDGGSIYVGEWAGGGLCIDHIEITPQSRATYYVSGSSEECYKLSPISGRFVAGDNSFRIGRMKFKIKQAPAPIDTIGVRLGYEDVKAVAAMTIVKPLLHGSDEVRMLKIIR